MKQTLLLLLLAVLPLSAQQTEKRPLGDFTEVEVTGHFDVRLVKTGDAILVTTNMPEYLKNIKTDISGGKLRIYAEGTVKGDVKITVPYKTLNSLSLNGSGDITADGAIKTNLFEVSLVGSGDIVIEVSAEKVAMALRGSGDLKLSGSADVVDAKVSGSGDLEAGSLKAKTTVVELTGSGDATVYASGTITAKVAGSGDIRYKGNPEVENTKVQGSGSITKV